MATATPNPRNRKNTVKTALTNRQRTQVGNKEFAEFVRRIIKASARRVAEGDIEALVDLVNLSRDLSQAIAIGVEGLRERHEYSWAEIARPLNITKQAAQQRWGGDLR